MAPPGPGKGNSEPIGCKGEAGYSGRRGAAIVVDQK